jgi:hypothetical protein
MSHSMIAAATATMTIAERKGAQFDSTIMDFMAISGLRNGHRARRRSSLGRERPKNIDPAQKRMAVF